jgi:hypothetical protein
MARRVLSRWSGFGDGRCGKDGARPKQMLSSRILGARDILALPLSLYLMAMTPAYAETPADTGPAAPKVTTASPEDDWRDSDETVELRLMGPRAEVPVISDCDTVDGPTNFAGVCVPLTPALLEKLRGMTRPEVTALMGSTGAPHRYFLYYFGNYQHSYATSTAGNTGDLTLQFEDGKVVMVYALLRGEGRKTLEYNWSHFAGEDEVFCSNLPEINKPCSHVYQ